ncbi:MAG: helix-turn-helix transcriptional regulator [Lachnospiraceae bacterium]|nr:helix-turn-helix transcriptional regulator [Lachnospiraceae bacterium]
MRLGETIYKLRTEKNLSQGDLAQMLDVSRQSISKWENNSAVPDLEKIIKLSEIFKVSLDELVKGEERIGEIPQEVKTEVVHEKVYEKHAGFPPHKIAGTILLCMAFLVTVLLMAAGGGLVGLIFASPFLVCGIICFVFQKNVGLWCAWAVYVLFDIYMSYATGINRANVLHTLQWTHHMNYMRLAFAWILVISLLIMMAITIIRLGKYSAVSEQKLRRQMIISWIVVVILQIVAMIWPRTGIFAYIWANILDWEVVYRLISLLLSWTRITAVTVALVYTVRFFRRKK